MDNSHVHNALVKRFDALYSELKATTLSERFRQEYDSVKSGSTVFFGSLIPSVSSELKRLSKDVSHDFDFRAAVENSIKLDENAIVDSLRQNIHQLISSIRNTNNATELQALFFEYDSYENPNVSVTGYGKQEYPIVTEPRYLHEEIDLTNVICEFPNAINFQAAWPDLERFEWTTQYMEVYYQLMELYQLKSRVLLHNAIQLCSENGELTILQNRPFTFYINEHDCETMTVFRLN